MKRIHPSWFLLAIVPAAGCFSGSSLNPSMAKKKREPKTPDPASFAFGVLQHVMEATGDKPDEPKTPFRLSRGLTASRRDG